MPHHRIRSSHDVESLAYGDAMICAAAGELRREVDNFITAASPRLAVDMKTDPLGNNSPVTRYDRDTEQRIGASYEGTTVRVKGEEEMIEWPADRVATLDLHVDPIDGTELFVEHLDQLIPWSQLPTDNRPPRPICGSMVSAGAIRPDSNTPEWAVIAAPFMAPKGIVRWTVGPQQPAQRIEPDGSLWELPPASAIDRPEGKGVILVASSSTERMHGDVLRRAGFRVIKYKSAVAVGLCMMDPGLFERLRPGELGDDYIAGVVMGSAKNWDVAGIIAVANDRGHFVSDTQGNPRTFEDGKRGGVFATHEYIGRTIVQAIAVS